MYVWVDALTNYITAVGYPDTDAEKFRKYWPCDLHVIGKDIVRFHAVYWPAFLMSAGVAVPRRIFSHGFIFNRGEKMSKSVGNVVDPFALADAYGVDPLRYFVLRAVPFGQDGNYSHEAIVTRINADLANDLGNLAQRSLTMVARNFGGALPEPGQFSEADNILLSSADDMIESVRHDMETQQLHMALTFVWTVIALANQYFTEQAPWALAKTDPTRQGTVLYVTAEVLRQVGILAQPFMPASADKLLDLLAVPDGERTFSYLGGKHRIAAGERPSFWLHLRLETLRQIAIIGLPFAPGWAGEKLDQLRVPEVERSFSYLWWKRRAAGAKLPAPAAVFPRYVEPGEKAAQ
jgi:methionyl-tRNA synthetase